MKLGEGLFAPTTEESNKPGQRESLVQTLFSKKTKDKYDLQYITSSSHLKGSTLTRGDSVIPDLIRLYVNAETANSSYEFHLMELFLQRSGMKHDIIKTRADSLLGRSLKFTQTLFLYW